MSHVETLTLKEVHVHYTCHCTVEAQITLNKQTATVEIEVRNKCPKCLKGKSTELVIGKSGIEAKGCPHKRCKCDSVTAQMPMMQLVGLLQA